MLLLLLACDAAPLHDKDVLTRLSDDTALAEETAVPADTAPSEETAVPADTALPEGSEAPPLIDDWIVLTDLFTDDEDGDGAWMPGDWLIVEGTLTNVRDEDYFMLPGVQLTTSSAEVVLDGSDSITYFGISRGSSVTFWLFVEARPDAPMAEWIDLTVEVFADGCPEIPDGCLDPQTQVLSRAIGD